MPIRATIVWPASTRAGRWPEQFMVKGVPHDYVVIDERRNPVEHSIKIHEIT